jgi:hypothetical protein
MGCCKASKSSEIFGGIMDLAAQNSRRKQAP